MLEFQKVTGIPGSVLTTVLTFTNTTTTKNLFSITIEGNARGEWSIIKNLTKISKARTSVPKTSKLLKFYRYELGIGDIIDVKVIHTETSADFSATLNYE